MPKYVIISPKNCHHSFKGLVPAFGMFSYIFFSTPLSYISTTLISLTKKCILIYCQACVSELKCTLLKNVCTEGSKKINFELLNYILNDQDSNFNALIKYF